MINVPHSLGSRVKEQIQWWKARRWAPYQAMLAMNYKPINPKDVTWQNVEIFAIAVSPDHADDYEDIVDGQRIR
jgi:hypothetical protein|tara:strand:+ start:1680 stop:1901 length:222 start_codon:yes stop_codon:yes gene_type:complete